MKVLRILCAVDADPMADRVFEWARDLAQKRGAELAVVSVLDAFIVRSAEGISSDTIRAELRSEMEAVHQRLLKRAPDASVRVFIEEGDPKREIVRVAKDWNADILVIGSHGRSGLARVFMGSVAEAVLRHSGCPVLVVPARQAAERASRAA